MKRAIFAAVAALMLPGCEVAPLFCDDDFDCSNNDFAHAAAFAPLPTVSTELAR